MFSPPPIILLYALDEGQLHWRPGDPTLLPFPIHITQPYMPYTLHRKIVEAHTHIPHIMANKEKVGSILNY